MTYGGRAFAVWLGLLVSTLGACATASRDSAHSAVPKAKNVIFMVADGAGYNTWRAKALYAGEPSFAFAADPGWRAAAVCVHPLCDGPVESGSPSVQDSTFVYDPKRAWDPTPVSGGSESYPDWFAGYRWLRRAPDSANTATAMATGSKTYIGAINVDGRGRPIEPTLATIAQRGRRSVGIVTTVQWSHATPATFGGAHAKSRGEYARIARDMLTAGRVNFIAGCGNPEFDSRGRVILDPEPKAYRYVGGREIWESLQGARRLEAGDSVATDFPEQAYALTAEDAERLAQWRLVTSLDEIESAGSETSRSLLVVPEVGRTLQQERLAGSDPHEAAPYSDPFIPGVPTLEALTKLALAVLGRDADGFFLHVEGGAVDWAMHDNQLGRMIEEMIDFERSLEAVVAWVEEHSDWSETLLVVTSDHDHLLWGPRADTVAFDSLEDRGAGRLPGHRWLSDQHSNSLVPVCARGVGSGTLSARTVGEDPVYGAYVDQTDLFRLVAEAMGAD